MASAFSRAAARMAVRRRLLPVESPRNGRYSMCMAILRACFATADCSEPSAVRVWSGQHGRDVDRAQPVKSFRELRLPRPVLREVKGQGAC